MSQAVPVIAGLAVGVMLIVIFAILPTNRNDDFDSRFAKYDIDHSIYLDMSTVENGNEDALQTVNKIVNVFDSCDYQLVQISYGLGSMRTAIEGMQNGLCSMAVEYEIEQGGGKLDCLVPRGRLASWMTWMNRAAPAVDEISSYCIRIGEIRPFR